MSETTVTIEFQSDLQANTFMDWFKESGHRLLQDYVYKSIDEYAADAPYDIDLDRMTNSIICIGSIKD